eukprot:10494198-Alexandrium_andersonii.AAC.1
MMHMPSVTNLNHTTPYVVAVGLSRAVTRVAAKPAPAAWPRAPSPPLMNQDEGVPKHAVRNP